MAKEVTALVKLQIKAGQANPAPPIGPVLGQHGVNIMEFCKQFNAKTQKNNGEVTPVVQRQVILDDEARRTQLPRRVGLDYHRDQV